MKHLTERVNITKPSKTSKKVFADDRMLKDLSSDEASSNVAVYYEEKGNFFIPAGKFYIYFMDNHENIKKLSTGEIEFLLFPHRRRFDWNAAPISDVWKKSHGGKGKEHILGMIEGQVYDEDKTVVVQMMSVRSPFKFNKINTFMIDGGVRELMKERFPDYKLAFEDPTDDGLEFIAKYDKNAQIIWTFRARPKKWATLQSEFTDVVNLKESLLNFSQFS